MSDLNFVNNVQDNHKMTASLSHQVFPWSCATDEPPHPSLPLNVTVSYIPVLFCIYPSYFITEASS